MTNETSQNEITPTVGQLLRTARIARDSTLEEVAKNLRISKRHLNNLEEDDETLVCDVYTIGFLRSYAQYLELDQDAIIQKFKKQTAPSQPPHLTFPLPLPERGMPSFRILSLSLVGLLAIVIMGWQWFGYYSSAPYTPEETPYAESNITIKEIPSPQEAASLFVEPSSPHMPEKNEHTTLIQTPRQAHPKPISSQGVLLKTTEQAWIEVKNIDGKVILHRLFEPGDQYEFKHPQNLLLKTGNARGTHLSGGGKNYFFPENSGTVRTNIPLDPEKWVEQIPDNL